MVYGERNREPSRKKVSLLSADRVTKKVVFKAYVKSRRCELERECLVVTVLGLLSIKHRHSDGFRPIFLYSSYVVVFL
jgi:hypothetical protein